MYDIIKSVILSGRYELSDMIKKIDTIWLQGDIQEEEKEELVALAQENANTAQSIEVLQKLEDHEKRLRALEQSGAEPGEEYPEYVPGKWYYKDDKITYNGKKYVCIAPEGQVCTWNPDEYPAYWQVAE